MNDGKIEELMTVEIIAEQTLLTKNEVRTLIKDGALKAAKIGKSYRIRKSVFEAWYQETFK